MVRHNPVSSLARNHRFNNKSRLKIIRGDFDSDNLVSNEDEEKDRWQQSIAGVDKEDVNEHHLLAALRAADAVTKKEEKAAYIPTPDSNGIVHNYETLYPTNRWKDPHSYVQSSLTVEESASAALHGGFTYYMDERDKEWLDRNNEEARGEGTSAQGASTRRSSTSSRSGKGKETDSDELRAEPVVMNEDEFELVMGLFEKIAHENTEFLYHALQNGMPFPPFSDYEPTFSSSLSPTTFALFNPPPWLPSPNQLVRIARAVYPHWKERRLERKGHRIAPVLNFDEEDTLNESYVCFRRLEAKALRKTRVQQVSYTDKLVRLQSEFGSAFELAKTMLLREQAKMEDMKQDQAIWALRARLVDLKSRNPTLFDAKDDEALLFDKERVLKKRKAEAASSVKETSKPEAGPRAQSQQPQSLRSDLKPPETRAREIQQIVEAAVAKQKEEDSQWENILDSGYVNSYVSVPSRHFKQLSMTKSSSPTPSSLSSDSGRPISSNGRQSLRTRVGRGGRLHVDRRLTIRVPPVAPRSSRHPAIVDSDDEQDTDNSAMDVDEDDVDQNAYEEADRRLTERWRFDSDDSMPVGITDEHDRMLIDDYGFKYLKHSMSLLGDTDFGDLSTDPTLTLPGADGKTETVTPFRLGMFSILKPLPLSSSTPSSSEPTLARSASTPRSQPVSSPTSSVKPVSILQRQESVMRISGNGGLPLRSTSVAATPSATSPSPTSSPPKPQATATSASSPPAQQQPLHQPRPIVNGIHRAAMTMPHLEVTKPTSMSPPVVPASTPSINRISTPTTSDAQMQSANVDNAGQTHTRPQSQQSQRQAPSATSSPHPSHLSPHQVPQQLHRSPSLNSPHIQQSRTATPSAASPHQQARTPTPSQTPNPRTVVNGHVHHPYSSSPLTTTTHVPGYAIPYSHLSAGYGRQQTANVVNGVKAGYNSASPVATPTPTENAANPNGSTGADGNIATNGAATHIASPQELSILQQLHHMQLRGLELQGLQSTRYLQSLQAQGFNLSALGLQNPQNTQGPHVQSYQNLPQNMQQTNGQGQGSGAGAYNAQAQFQMQLQMLQSLTNMGHGKMPVARPRQGQPYQQQQHVSSQNQLQGQAQGR
ncbi:hypothetical protein D9758_005386 [Tetrapyrgos nigripes]|uniref:Enhancer of polycomb-like protein n=1 Tax=Tetrapyrgos nigripes TaxID=182062 RepID=A0A8H5GHT0_9AGAR|nr:hypothetical protein D9758_005386 [Tetrapyrgos nigripes]